jgi:hypothetical protein
VSSVVLGSVHDKTAFDKSDTVDELARKYPSPTVTHAGVTYQLAIGADKAYPRMKKPQDWHLHVTKTAEGTKEIDDDGQEVGPPAKNANLVNVFFDEKIAEFRSVVERTFGRMKKWRVLESPRHLMYEKKCEKIAQLIAAIVNWEIRLNKIEQV